MFLNVTHIHTLNIVYTFHQVSYPLRYVVGPKIGKANKPTASGGGGGGGGEGGEGGGKKAGQQLTQEEEYKKALKEFKLQWMK